MPHAVAASLTVFLSIDPFLFHCWLVMFLLAFNSIKWCYICNSTLPCLFFNVSVFPDSKIIPQLLPNLKESPLTISWSVTTMWTRCEPKMHGIQLLCYLEILNAYSNPFYSQLEVCITSITIVNTTQKKLNYHFWSFQHLVFILMRDETIIKPSLGIKQLEC